MRHLLAALMIAVGLASPASAQIVFGSYSDWLGEQIAGFPGTGYEIAPMAPQGSADPGGPWTDVSNDIFSAILARAGIVPCASAIVTGEDETPLARVGQLDVVDPSLVLNKGGKRLTFGYFVHATQGAWRLAPCDAGLCREDVPGDDWFVLMSYDTVPTAKLTDLRAGETQLCAFEVFTFGPVVRPGAGEDFEPWAPWVDGTAVNAEGNRLQGVPANIAIVQNFKEGRPGLVLSGTGIEGQGCNVCHAARADGITQTTLPFPWLRTHG